jgi:hypothetical protein
MDGDGRNEPAEHLRVARRMASDLHIRVIKESLPDSSCRYDVLVRSEGADIT